MEDDKPIDLRDKLAIEILNAILSSDKGQDHADDIIQYINNENDKWHDGAVERMEKIIRNCYKVADIMRKVRLSTFE